MVVQLSQKADKASKSLEEERYSRMVAEETLQKNDAKLVTFQQELKDTQDKMANILTTLKQEKTINSDLKKKYDELNQTKAGLEAQLQSALKDKAAAMTALQSQGRAEAAVSAAQPAGAGH
ncbi:MAG: hypothetical protein KGK03_07845 [Candidatus Omnitrophica bacterium]|nr:hypothetical protein [Candidatus Omnitrophota bacterium]